MSSAIFARASRDWAAMRHSYELYLKYAYEAALEGTGGVLVNREGRALHIDGLDLFTGPRWRAEKYASEELREYWLTHPRVSLAEHERRWITGEERWGDI